MTSAAKQRRDGDDPTIYPIDGPNCDPIVGEDSLQRFIAELFRMLVERYLRERGTPTFVGADQFIYWEQHNPTKVVAPDVYVLPGFAPGARVKCLKTWEAGVVPSFALEIVSSNDVDKDYRAAPARYAELGVQELVVFDPDFRDHHDRLRIQLFRRLPRRGLIRIEATNEDRVRSRVLGAWLRAVGSNEQVRLRLATGPRGDELFPTEAEAERAGRETERAGRVAERAGREAAEAGQEAERAGREAAEAELGSLRVQLARLERT